MPSAEDAAQFLVRRILGGQGLSNFRHWSLCKQPHLAQALRDLQAMGEVTRLRIEGHGNVPHFALTAAVKSALRGHRAADELHILSPFDNLIIWRDRLKRLFDFDYGLECYVPAPKRRYGYFCLPVLWGDRFVGRLDAKAQRRQGSLLVHTLRFEPGAWDYEVLLPELARKLQAFAAFNGCNRVIIAQATPNKVLATLRRAIKQLS
jgi:hypothetical protein